MLETINHRVDLCVVGGGMSGVCAAIAAARNGIKTLLMQERPMLGGNASSEVRMWICGAHGENNRETGIIEEIALENLYRNPDKNHFLFDYILLEKVKAEAEGDFILLRPANETLIDYYSKCGFKTVKSSVCSGCLKVIPIDGYKTLLEISHLSDDRDFTAMYYTERNIEAEVIEFNCSMN